MKFVTDYSQHREETGWLQILCISLLGTVKAEEKFNMITVKTLYKSSNMDCSLQNLTLLLLLFQPPSATDELIPPAPEKDSWGFRKGSGWMKSIHRDGTAIIRGLTTLSPTPGILQLPGTWRNTSEYSSFLKKLSVFPRTCFSYINSCQVCSHRGRELVWTSFHSLLQVQAVPFIIHVYSLLDGDLLVLLFNSSFLEAQWMSTLTSDKHHLHSQMNL